MPNKYLDYRDLDADAKAAADSIAHDLNEPESVTEAVSEFYNHFSDRLGSTIFVLTMRIIDPEYAKQHAADVEQEYFFRLLRARSNPEAQPFENGRHLFAWSSQVIRHMAIDRRQKKSQAPKTESINADDDESNDGESPRHSIYLVSDNSTIETLEEWDCTNMLKKCLDARTYKQRMAWVLNRVDGMKQTAIADMEGVTQAAISQRVTGASEGIAECLDDTGCDDMEKMLRGLRNSEEDIEHLYEKRTKEE